MTFLNIIALLALPLMALPVIIHLLNRLRFQNREWAAMQFLFAADRTSTRHARVRNFLILLARTLAVAALIAVLARPLAGGWFGGQFAGAPDTVILVLDTSPSMGRRMAGTNEDTALDRAINGLQSASSLLRGSHLLVMDPSSGFPTPLTDLGRLRALRATKPFDAPTPIAAMLMSAADHLAQNPVGRAEIWIASDLAESDWAPESLTWERGAARLAQLETDVRIRVLAVGAPLTENRALHITAAERVAGERPGLRLSLRIDSDEPDEVEIPITIQSGDSRIQKTVTLGGYTTRFGHVIEIAGDAGWGRVEIPSDRNARDNVAYFAYAPEAEQRVVVVAEDARSGPYLSGAAAPFGDSGRTRVELSERRRFETLKSTDLAALIWQGSLPRTSEWPSIETYLNAGGVVLLLPGTGSGSDASAYGATWLAASTASNAPGMLRDWESDSGPLASTDLGAALPVDELLLFTHRNFVMPNARVLAAHEDGTPLLQSVRVGDGVLYALGSLPRPDWSTLADGTVLVPMLSRMITEGATRLHPAPMRECGVWRPASGTDWALLSGDGEAERNSGVYNAGAKQIALNTPSRESGITRLDALTVKELMAPLPVRLWEEQGRDANQRAEVWKLFLAGMLILLLVEGFLTLPRSARAPEVLP